MKKERYEIEKILIEHNKFPLLSSLPKKEIELFIACLELEIRDYYSKQQSSTIKVPP